MVKCNRCKLNLTGFDRIFANRVDDKVYCVTCCPFMQKSNTLEFDKKNKKR